MEEPTQKPRRRWFQFGLSTVFVVMTSLAVFLAYNVNWMRQRRALVVAPGDADTRYFIDPEDPFGDGPPPAPRAPGLLRLFGESGHSDILVRFGDPFADNEVRWKDRNLTRSEQAEVDRVRRLFPEAHVRSWAVEKR
jgi:hypothetical protein